MTALLARACGLWVLLAALAIINGTLREKALAPLVGHELALPVSGVSLILMIFLVALLALPRLGAQAASQYWLVGGVWLMMTVSFEFLFGHYVAGKPWAEILAAYDLTEGNLWVLVQAATLASPYLAAKLRGLL